MIDVLNPDLPPGAVTALSTDDPAEIVGFAAACLGEGGGVALAPPRPGSGAALRALVAADGRFCVHVSGGGLARRFTAADDEGVLDGTIDSRIATGHTVPTRLLSLPHLPRERRRSSRSWRSARLLAPVEFGLGGGDA